MYVHTIVWNSNYIPGKKSVILLAASFKFILSKVLSKEFHVEAGLLSQFSNTAVQYSIGFVVSMECLECLYPKKDSSWPPLSNNITLRQHKQ